MSVLKKMTGFVYLDFKPGVFQRENSKKWGFSMKPLQHFFKKNIFSFFTNALVSFSFFTYLLEVHLYCYSSLISTWRSKACLFINIPEVIPLVRYTRPTGQSESCGIPPERLVAITLASDRLFCQLQKWSAAFLSSTAQDLCEAALCYNKVKRQRCARKYPSTAGEG